MSGDLAVALHGRIAGVITHDCGRPAFTYTPDYLGDSTPLSLSMPLRAGAAFPHKVVRPWLAGLLPDDERVLQAWAAEFDVSHRNHSDLLRHMGRDCAGAVQIADPNEFPALFDRAGHYEPASEADIADRLRGLLKQPSRWARRSERWSLAGAQGKFTAARTASGWAWTHGNALSTHIIKPGIPSFDSQALNEHICQTALGILGMHVATTEYHEFDGVPAVAVTRYDRRTTADGVLRRVHQEDMCQALSVSPQRKYASDPGGVAAVHIAGLLNKHCTQGNDIDRFTDAVVAQYLIGAPDAHAKNYGVILHKDRVALAPLYDVASSLPYLEGPRGSLARVAMPINGKSRFGEVSLRDVEAFARSAGTDPDRLVQRTRELAAALPDAIEQAAAGVPSGSGGDLAIRLRDSIAQQCATLDAPPRRAARTAPPTEPRPGGGEAPQALMRSAWLDDSDDPQTDSSEDEVLVVSHRRGTTGVRTYTRRRPARRPSR